MRNIIIFSTRRGFSEKLAKMLAEKIPGETFLANVKEKPDISGYDNVILGGAVIAGEIRNGMRKYAEQKLGELKEKKVALFASCMDEDKVKIREYIAKSFPPALLSQAVAMESLGGAYDPEQENLVVRGIMNLMKAKASEKVLESNMDKIARALQ
jgi:menaquinone-dependent protoporphyrinogen oxidase